MIKKLSLKKRLGIQAKRKSEKTITLLYILLNYAKKMKIFPLFFRIKINFLFRFLRNQIHKNSV